MTGILPTMISYPNGNYSNDIIRLSKMIKGLKFVLQLSIKKLISLF